MGEPQMAIPEEYLGDDDLPESDAPIPEEHPQAALWRVLVMPVRPKKVSKGGIILAQQARQAEAALNYVGRVVSAGPMAWKDPRFAGITPPKVGEYIVYGRYAGQPIEHQGTRYLFINDDEWLGTVSDPESLKIYV